MSIARRGTGQPLMAPRIPLTSVAVRLAMALVVAAVVPLLHMGVWIPDEEGKGSSFLGIHTPCEAEAPPLPLGSLLPAWPPCLLEAFEEEDKARKTAERFWNAV